MNLSKPFIERPVMTTLVMAALVIFGAYGYASLPVSDLPNIDFPTISVFASLPGADPDTMASSVASPLENQFSTINGIDQMTSSSTQGSTQIQLQFALDRSLDGAAQDVQSAISAATRNLPKALPQPPTFRKQNPADLPIMFLAMSSKTLKPSEVDEYAETLLARQVSTIEGVAQVGVFGSAKYAVRIQADPAALATRQIGIDKLVAAVANANVNLATGALNGATRSTVIHTGGQLNNAAEFNDQIVTYQNGSPVRLKDVARVIDGLENPYAKSWYKDQEAIVLAVFRQPGSNVVQVTDTIKKVLPQFKANLPPSVSLDVVFDRSQVIRSSISDVQTTLLIAGALVVGVIFVFLRRVSATIIPSLALPIAVIGTFAGMAAFGFNLDNLSLMALTLSVGFVVDDAIVMLENIYRHIEAGLSPLEATLKGADEVGFTILSISISLVAVFIPLLLMGGIIGRLFREFAVTMTMTIAVSACVALTLSPTMCALFLRDEKHARHGRAYLAVERAFDRLLAWYTRGLDFALDHQRGTLAVFLVTVAITVVLYVEIPKGFFPQQDTGIISGLSDAPQDISFEEMVRRQHALLDVVSKDPDVASYGTVLGGNRPINNSFVVLGLKPRGERKSSADQIINRLRPKLAQVPGATLFMQAAQDLNVGGRTTRTQYQYTLQDSDIEELNSWAPKLLVELQKLSMLRDVASDQQTSSGMLSLTIDRDQASRFGIQPAAIDQALYDAFGQRQAAQFFTQANSYHVVLEITPALQRDPASLEKLYLKSPLTGQMVPLSAMTRYDTQHVTYLSINHQGQFPAVTLSFNLAPGAALGDAVDAINRVSANMRLPATITGSFQGTAQAFQSSLKSQPYLILAALVAVYIILGMLYESYVHPLTILSTLPSAGLGALLVLFIFHIDLSVMALIGIILLIGIVKKNGIMMVDFAIQAEREQHLTPHDAIRQACLLRFRPIMMTTMAALLGALPLALGRGTGSELRQPLGYTMVGGLIVSQALTLFTTPVIYLYLDQFSLWMKRRRKSHPIDEAPNAQPVPAGESP
jgi:hydrophobic/amphiphilic exporter-1 (mainly G- bacteria), HAE1 family